MLKSNASPDNRIKQRNGINYTAFNNKKPAGQFARLAFFTFSDVCYFGVAFHSVFAMWAMPSSSGWLSVPESP